jgi:lipopolysaccharide transport system permease protein
MSTRIVLEAGKTDGQYFRDLWRYRGLFYILAWRDVSVRYKQTAIGIAWAILRPALSTAVFTVVFGRLGKFPSNGSPYPVMVLAGMLPWQLFSTALSESGSSLTSNANLITKVYFPRIIIPGSSLVASLVDFTFSIAMLAVLLIVYRVAPTWRLVFLPVFVILSLAAAAGIGAWMSALNVKYRDFAFVVPFIVQLGLYISPVGFSSSLVPDRWRPLYSLNPMVGVINGFRWCILRQATPIGWPGLLCSVAVISTILVSGFFYFRHTERAFADII